MTSQLGMPGLTGLAESSKPRTSRLTMVLDKGMGLAAMSDWLPMASPYFDICKFGWGTAGVLPEELLQSKVDMLRQFGVQAMPGGTLTELYFLQNRLDELVADYRRLGFELVEVSDGTVPMLPQQRLGLITRLISEGFRVVTEVGSKQPARDRRISPEQRAALANADLEAGAEHVIVEARESGTLGFFGEDKAVDEEALGAFLALVDPERVVFEAPLKSQQVDLIKRLGSNVNLGNIPPEEVIPLETLRQGLRGDTLLDLHGNPPVVRTGLGPAGALEASRRGDVIVVVDALRASTTIAAALAAGASDVTVVSRVDECVGEVTAGERGGVKVPEFDLDNSPVSMLGTDLSGKSLVLTTTNGTECILAAGSNPDVSVFVGSLTNATVVAEAVSKLARESGSDITVVSAGRNQSPAPEDDYAAAEIILSLGAVRLHPNVALPDPGDAMQVFHESASGKNLIERGKEVDVAFCAQRDVLTTVPRVIDGKIVSAE